MKTILDEAQTWFFDGLSHNLDGSLTINLVEGIKAAEPQMVDFGTGTLMGPYYSIQVLPNSKCAQIEFQEAHLFFVYNESFDVGDDLLKGEDGVLRKVAESSFQEFIKAHTGITSIRDQNFDSYLIWTEDRVFQVACSDLPSVTLRNKSPDLSASRTSTWSAS